MKKKLLVTFGILLLFACTKKECFDISREESASYLQKFQSFFVYQYLSGLWLQDTTTKAWHFWEKTPNQFVYNSATDECGNKQATYSYKTSFLQENGTAFFLEFVGDDKRKSYILHFLITDSLKGIRQKISYDLISEKSLEDSTNAEVLRNYNYEGKTYEKVLKLEFTNVLHSGAVKTFYYTGYDGLLGFEKANGKVFR